MAPKKPQVRGRGICGDSGPADQNTLPFRVTVDGQPLLSDPLMPEADRERCVDVALDAADIQLRYDPLQTKPALNVWLEQDGVLAGEPVSFGSYSNYLPWIERGEIRIFRQGEERTATPLAVLPVNWQGSATWTPPSATPAGLQFVLRVHDRQGHFDETAMKTLQLLATSRPHDDRDTPAREGLTGWGEDSRTVANIPVSGGTVTVNGSGIRPDEQVVSLGQKVPVDTKGSFALLQILPAGPHTATVEVIDAKGNSRRFSRNLTIPDQDWFYVALGDLTMGQNRVTGPAQLVNPDAGEYDGKVYVNGRAAFYLKGKIKGEYLLTAAADTREQPIEDLFTNFSSKDPRYLLRRIDPDRYYPVYGDDSTMVEDAPTEGKFYVRLERGDSHILWGNFQTAWSGSELTQFSRALYGADLRLKSDSTTSYGERKGELDAFAADPGTLQSREDFRGTGGSLYYLRHMDLTRGGERLWIEVRDRDSGLVLERKQLVPVQDYDINYLQGRVTLRSPLSSTTGSGTFMAIGSLPGNPLYLVATYEYVPGVTAVDGSTLGLSAGQWLGDHLNVGITGYRQGENSQAQKLLGANATMRYRPGTYLRGEFAQSEGRGTGQQDSITGGFDFSSNGAVGERAEAGRVDAALDLAELYDAGKGKGSVYWQQRGEGFSAPGELTPGESVRQMGGRLTLPLSNTVETELKGDDRSSLSQEATSLEGVLRWQMTPQWQVGGGVRQDEKWSATANASPILSESGDRTDLQLRLGYHPLVASKDVGEERPADWDLYGYTQETVNKNGNRRDNDRVGLGGGWQVVDRFRLTAEGSGGTGGGGGLLGGDYRISDRSNLYLTYSSEVERPDVSSRGRYSTAVIGSRSRVTDQVAIYGETKSTQGAGPESLVHAFGLDLSPND
ncbi:MAG TPA: flagellar motor protein MotB, partial [Geobacterales bacterium]|nr:flagellar motor protein MotB [Geobacterales bacterium]